ncbi:hypothetical protein MC885_003485 [Smutsia gigantea]|nr:hypothetical protein MC885_003485 [Smutsia gigantea]
MRRFWL